MRRILLILAMAAMLVGMLATLPGPAFADDDDCDGGKKHDRPICRDRDDDDIDVEDIDIDFEEFEIEDEIIVSPLFISPFFLVEIDVDCDEIDDDLDGLIDEGAVCVLEFD